ncbi:MAG: hypothetical protein IJ255_03075 [Bacteroidales bacterium]|nr:hypothetical protein [Bacteroidales bacterium]
MKRTILTVLMILLACACSMQRKVGQLKDHPVTLALDDGPAVPEIDLGELRRDTLTVTDEQGKEVLIMRAVKDIDGEMVATDVLQAARVTARFRNVAERAGKVDLRFEVRVPREMQDSRWQLKFYPEMEVLDETVPLDPVVITGDAYRKAQLRGYQHYQRFLDSIISDSTLFLNARQLELFIRRNIPELYRFREDTSLVSDETFASVYGVTQQQAVEHYKLRYKIRRNDRRIARKGQMFNRYVKVPIVTEGLRLDTVMTGPEQDFIYSYVQPVHIRPQLRKVDIRLRGDIFEQNRRIYRVPQSDPLTFYISSLSSFAAPVERYLTRIVERKAEAHTACYIDFASGSSAIDLKLDGNAQEIGRIRDNLRELAVSDTYAIDSIVVTASCSPEGEYRSNERLARQRSASVSGYFSRVLQEIADSVRREEGIVLDLEDAYGRQRRAEDIRFIARHEAENWSALDQMVERDSLLSGEGKASYRSLRQIREPDRREAGLQTEPYYRYLREKVYPRLRTVRFDFHLSRKGMVQDTIHTTVPDTVYQRGVQAIRDRDYEQAVTLLRPYRDFNTAVAYLCLDYNASAMDILKDLERTPPVLYMTAILHARQGDDRSAVEAYLRACERDPSYVHRGNLDPEISALIARYGLNREPEEDTIY